MAWWGDIDAFIGRTGTVCKANTHWPLNWIKAKSHFGDLVQLDCLKDEKMLKNSHLNGKDFFSFLPNMLVMMLHHQKNKCTILSMISFQNWASQLSPCVKSAIYQALAKRNSKLPVGVHTWTIMVARKSVLMSLPRNKARYPATLVACGWAGAIFEVTRPFGQEQWTKKNHKKKWNMTDQPTNQQTNQCTAGQSGV